MVVMLAVVRGTAAQLICVIIITQCHNSNMSLSRVPSHSMPRHPASGW